jgi:hypothetical protein
MRLRALRLSGRNQFPLSGGILMAGSSIEWRRSFHSARCIWSIMIRRVVISRSGRSYPLISPLNNIEVENCAATTTAAVLAVGNGFCAISVPKSTQPTDAAPHRHMKCFKREVTVAGLVEDKKTLRGWPNRAAPQPSASRSRRGSPSRWRRFQNGPSDHRGRRRQRARVSGSDMDNS